MSARIGTNWRGVGSALLMFAAGFVVVAGVVHGVVGNGLRLHADIRSEKLEMMDEWQGRAYTAAFGSSHVHFGFDPRSFDQTMAGTGQQTRSLNLAVEGGSQTEQRAIALAYIKRLQAPPKIEPAAGARACLVMLELNAGANFTNEHLFHPRTINIYDWQMVQFVWRLTRPEMSLKQRIGRAGFAVEGALFHYTNIGMLSSKIFSPSINEAMLQAETVDDRRGLSVIQVQPSVMKEIVKILADAPSHATGEPLGLLPGNRTILDELRDASPVKNVAMVYVVMPKLSDLTSYPTTPESVEWSGGTAPILNMARPDLYPEIYEANNWFDNVHLSERGAALVSKLMANHLKRWYAEHGAPARCGG